MPNYSDYLQRKHRIFFRFLDLDSDGKLFKTDFLQRVEKMSHLNVVSEEESKNTRYRWMRIGNFIFSLGKDDEVITEDGFAQRLQDIWTTDSYFELSLLLTGIYDVLFDRLDTNRDGCISREELSLYYKSIGSTSEEFVDKLFRTLDEDKDGRLTKNEFIKAGALFWMSNDSSNGMEIMYDVHK